MSLSLDTGPSLESWMGPTLSLAREQARQDVEPNRHLNLILVLTHVGEQFPDLCSLTLISRSTEWG